MPIPWGIIIALFVLGFALLIKHVFAEVVEEHHVFHLIVGAFFIVYISAALIVGSFNPKDMLSAQVFAGEEGL